MAGRLIVLAGCSGSGKSTYAREVFPEALVVSADHFFEGMAARSGGTYQEVWALALQGAAHALCREHFLEAIRAGQPLVLVDNANVRASDRQRFAKMGLAHRYDVEFHVLGPWLQGTPPPTPEAAAAYVNLCHGRNVHGVPRAAIVQQFNNLDLPSGVYGAGHPAPFLRPLDPQPHAH